MLKDKEPWKIKSHDNLYLEGLKINSGINFLIGKNNIGKSRIAKSIKENDGVVTDINGVVQEVIYIDALTTSIESENIAKNRIIHSGIGNILDDNKNKKEYSGIEDVFYTNWNTGSENINNFLKNKNVELEIKEIVKTKSKINGYDSIESGTGESRMTLFAYVIGELLKKSDNFARDLYSSDSVIRYWNSEIKNEILECVKLLENFNTPEEYVNKAMRKLIAFFKSDEDIVIKQIIFNEVIGLLDRSILEESIKEELKIIRVLLFDGLTKKEEDIFKKWINDNTNVIKENPGVLLIIDEPENFIHKSKIKLFFDLINNLLVQKNIDVRILLITHSEYIYSKSEYLENIFLVQKTNRDKYIKVVNIFGEDINIFTNNVIKNAERIEGVLQKKEVNNLKDNYNNFCKETKVLKEHRIDYIKFVLANNNNLEILFKSGELNVVEGFSDKIILGKLLNKDNLIETNGIHVKLLIWLEILKSNKNLFDKVNFYIDYDYNINNKETNYINEEIKHIIQEYSEETKNIYIYNPPIKDSQNFLWTSIAEDKSDRKLMEKKINFDMPEEEREKYWATANNYFMEEYAKAEQIYNKNTTFLNSKICEELSLKNNGYVFRSPSTTFILDDKEEFFEKYKKWVNNNKKLNFHKIKKGKFKFDWSEEFFISYKDELFEGYIFEEFTTNIIEEKLLFVCPDFIAEVSRDDIYDFADNWDDEFPDRVYKIDEKHMLLTKGPKFYKHKILDNTFYIKGLDKIIVINGVDGKIHYEDLENKFPNVSQYMGKNGKPAFGTLSDTFENSLKNAHNRSLFIYEYSTSRYPKVIIDGMISKKKSINAFVCLETNPFSEKGAHIAFFGPFKITGEYIESEIDSKLSQLKNIIKRNEGWEIVDKLEIT